MPKIKSYAPSWLKAPAPGHQLFAEPEDGRKGPASQFRLSSRSKPGPRRTIARRGTEVFVAAGKQIRWGDLAQLKGSWESKQQQHRSGFRTTIKREDSDSFEIYDEDPDSAGQSWAQGEACRVSTLHPPYTGSSFVAQDLRHTTQLETLIY